MALYSKNIITYKDVRGEVYPCWRDDEYSIRFVEDRFSRSIKNTIRGFHGDATTWKLFTCVYGTMLSDENKLQVLVPPYYLNAHECLSDECVLYYKWSENYSGPENQWTVSYKDKEINASWFTDNPILSARDKEASSLRDLMETL